MVDTKKIVTEVLHSTAVSQGGVQVWICTYPKVEIRILYKAAKIMTSWAAISFWGRIPICVIFPRIYYDWQNERNI